MERYAHQLPKAVCYKDHLKEPYRESKTQPLNFLARQNARGFQREEYIDENITLIDS